MSIYLIKIGSNVLLHQDNIDLHTIQHLCEAFSYLKKNGITPVVVSSGAVALGSKKLGETKKTFSQSKSYHQFLASFGWPRIYRYFADELQKHAIDTTHILLTPQQFVHPSKRLHLQEMLLHTIEEGFLPIINENDAIAIDEDMFVDNDEVTKHLGELLRPQKTILLTNVDGLCHKDPEQGGAVISHIADINATIFNMVSGQISPLSRGGMQSKIQTAQAMSQIGIDTHVANGKTKYTLQKIHQGQSVGTIFLRK